MIDSRFFYHAGSQSLESILHLTGATLSMAAPIDSAIQTIAPLDTATSRDVACYHNPTYLNDLTNTQAGFCFIKAEEVQKLPKNCIGLVTPTPYRAFALVSQHFYPLVDKDYASSSSPIDPTATLGEGCIIEAGAVIQRHAVVGKGVKVGANAVIGKGVIIGDECIIEAGASITHALIGNKCIIGTGVRIGQAGFGFFMDEKGHVTVPQLGRVIIGQGVEIGANTTIDRGSLKDTIIGDGCRLDNLVQIAHNVVLGKGCVIVSQAGIAGSTCLGDYVIVAGQVGIAGHLHIGHHVRIAAQSGVIRDIEPFQTMAGSPALPVSQWHRQTVTLNKLIKNQPLRHRKT